MTSRTKTLILAVGVTAVLSMGGALGIFVAVAPYLMPTAKQQPPTPHLSPKRTFTTPAMQSSVRPASLKRPPPAPIRP
jgi:hypothetical protein